MIKQLVLGTPRAGQGLGEEILAGEVGGLRAVEECLLKVGARKASAISRGPNCVSAKAAVDHLDLASLLLPLPMQDAADLECD